MKIFSASCRTTRAVVIMVTMTIMTFLLSIMVSADEPLTESEPSIRKRVLPDRIEMKLVAKHKHDPKSFCQGLLFTRSPEGRDLLLESKGQYTRSQLRETDLVTGNVLRHTSVPDRFFAEGIALFGDRIYQLTWQERTCFIYDRSTLEKRDEIRCPFEGWGLTTGPDGLYLSDGSATIRVVSPDDFTVIRTFAVTYKNGDNTILLDKLNELEYIEGELWANVYQTPFVARIDPTTGVAFDLIDFSVLIPKKFQGHQEYVLNGIAYDSEGKRLFLTGKCWSILYEIQITTTNEQGASAHEK